MTKYGMHVKGVRLVLFIGMKDFDFRNMNYDGYL